MPANEIALFHHCTILTFDKAESVADAMAVRDGKILAVGTADRVRHAIEAITGQNGPGDRPRLVEMDAGGACIVPGFIDTHLHPGVYIYFKTQLDMSGARSYRDLEQLIQMDSSARAPDEWILGKDIMEDLFHAPEERHFPTRVELDRASPTRPVVVLRHDGHICAVNSLALDALGINKESVEARGVAGGEIRVDGAGEPTGVFTETATAIPLERVPIPGMDRLKAATGLFSRELASFGITTFGGIVQLGAEGIAGQVGAVELPLLELTIQENLIVQDMVLYLVTSKPRQLKRTDAKFKKMDAGGGRFVVGGIKLYADGSYGARTAAMFEPYSDSASGESGFMVKDAESLLGIFKETHELGYQVAIHAIGDKANRTVVDLFGRLLASSDKPHRHRVEHASTLDAGMIADAARLGLTFCCQPAFIDSEFTWLEARLGPRRIKKAYPFKSIVDAGVVLAGASDAPIESASVLKAIQACVTRRGLVPEERIPVMAALRMFTINAAHAIGQEDVKGSIEPGKAADIVLLGRDPRAVPASELGAIHVLATYHRGVKIYP
ncbi:MAG: amidohydrolase [Candidatus Lokiarchaeota archaeon]|nr:amidohydrolase [Candidatus Lokiarchaeota archaeon]